MAELIKKSTVGNVAFWVCLIASVVLMVAGFIVPPTGVIDGSVLKGVGELFGFATLFVVGTAINRGVDVRLQHGKTTATIGDLNGTLQEEQIQIEQENEETY